MTENGRDLSKTDNASKAPEDIVLEHFGRCWRGECTLLITFLTGTGVWMVFVVLLLWLENRAAPEQWSAESAICHCDVALDRVNPAGNMAWRWPPTIFTSQLSAWTTVLADCGGHLWWHVYYWGRLGCVGCHCHSVDVYRSVDFMTHKEGTLHLQPSGRWAIFRPGHEPFELTSGDVFRVEVDGKLQITRMGHLSSEGYYSIEGYPLRDGMRAAIGVEALPRKKAKISDQGKLCRLPAGGWAIAAPGRSPVAIFKGEIFEVQIGEQLWRARMKSDGTAEGVRIVGERIKRVPVALCEGMLAGFFDGRERYAKPL